MRRRALNLKIKNLSPQGPPPLFFSLREALDAKEESGASVFQVINDVLLAVAWHPPPPFLSKANRHYMPSRQEFTLPVPSPPPPRPPRAGSSAAHVPATRAMMARVRGSPLPAAAALLLLLIALFSVPAAAQPSWCAGRGGSPGSDGGRKGRGAAAPMLGCPEAPSLAY